MRVRTLIAGCGYVGIALGQRLLAEGHEVWGVRRDVSNLPAGFRPLAADLAAGAGLGQLPTEVDYVVYSASAGEGTDTAYARTYVTGLQNVLGRLRASSLRRAFFTSSTAVYAQVDGSWVDEDSETAPSHFTGKRTLEAEQLLEASGLPFTVLRCAGIYGPDRTRLIDSVREGTARGSMRVSNRVHRDDVAGAVAHLMRSGSQTTRLILSDDAPAPQIEVMRFLAERLGVAPPKLVPDELTAVRGGHKRCRNTRLKATGYVLQYPTYREGYGAMLAAPSA